jgi:hypothetical protein
MPLLRVEVTGGCVEWLIRSAYSVEMLFISLSGISVFAYALAQCELVPGYDFSFWLRMELEEPGSRMSAPPSELCVFRLRVSILPFLLYTGFVVDKGVSFPSCERFYSTT